MEPSLSMFILYLGMADTFRGHENVPPHTNMWYLPDYDLNKMYNMAAEGSIDDVDCFLLRLAADRKSAMMLVFAPFNSAEYWNDNKKRLIDLFMKKVDRFAPGFSSDVIYKDAATPATLSKWTMNYKGASYGWAGTPSQLAVSGFTQRTDYENLYLTGHWATLVQGVGGVAYLGRETSSKIIKRVVAK
jgi:prolycopene isomerase